MSQEIRVVKCFQCRMLQTDIVKQVNKWQCKVCGTKQSLIQEYCRGTGKTCRDFVQKMNERSSSIDVLHVNELDDRPRGDAIKYRDQHLHQQSRSTLPCVDEPTNTSKWLAYTENVDENVSGNQFD